MVYQLKSTRLRQSDADSPNIRRGTDRLSAVRRIQKRNKMKKEEIQALFSQFEQVSCVLNDVECWSARDLCSLLGYKLWQNFTKVIDKAKEACVNVGQNVEDHFIDVNKMVVIGSGAERQIDVKKVERRLASEQKKAMENKKKHKMEQNKKELLLGQIDKINEVISTLSENFSQENITNH